MSCENSNLYSHVSVANSCHCWCKEFRSEHFASKQFTFSCHLFVTHPVCKGLETDCFTLKMRGIITVGTCHIRMLTSQKFRGILSKRKNLLNQHLGTTSERPQKGEKMWSEKKPFKRSVHKSGLWFLPARLILPQAIVCLCVCCIRPLTAPTGKASTAIIQSLRPISFLSCRSCSLLSLPLVSRLDTSIRTHNPKNTAWITCRETDTGRVQRARSQHTHSHKTNTSKRGGGGHEA